MAMNINVSGNYLAKPFEMEAGRWTITSQPPTVNNGKMYAAFLSLQQQQYQNAEAGIPPENAMPDGWPADDEAVMRLVLGNAEYERLCREECPFDLMLHATMCAIYYWAYGGSELAVMAYLETANFLAGDEAPKDLQNQLRSAIGLSTE